ncbi:MAG: triose-phosphate isomerase [Rhodocyclaceae bacterium]|nr:triose-phosphate isomerase [Rhodocyclaceae bacterium]
MRRKFVAGNWKMHGTLQNNALLIDALKVSVAGLACEVAICPPYPYLAQAAALLGSSGIQLGAQNLSEFVSGAYTGEVSAPMLGEFGCRYVLVGHSERRAIYGESDSVVVAKFAAAQAGGLVPVLCVGESLEERQAGKTSEVVSRQLAAVIDRLGVSVLTKSVIAYEPVWAIGTGVTASAGQAQEVHQAIRSQVAALDPVVANGVRVLYGGSVKPQNAKELFGQPDIDGGLIGGAALVAGDFLAICRAAG